MMDIVTHHVYKLAWLVICAGSYLLCEIAKVF